MAPTPLRRWLPPLDRLSSTSPFWSTQRLIRNRVPVLLSLAYGLVWYRNRWGWLDDVVKEDAETGTAVPSLTGESEKEITTEEKKSTVESS